MKYAFTLLAGSSMLAGCATMDDRADTAINTVAEAADAATVAATAVDNPVLAEWTGPYDGVPQWDAYTPDQLPQAFDAGMAEVKAEYETILSNPATPTFDNFVVPLEKAGEILGRVYPVYGVYTSNLSNPDVRAIQAEWSPKLSAFFSELNLDPRLVEKYKYLYDNRAKMGLDAKQQRLIERAYDGLKRDGALLDAAKKPQLIALNTELAGLYSDFSNKVLADEETYIFLDSADDLAGLPASFVASLKKAAEEQGKSGWAIKNTRSVMQPFMENSTRRDLREKVYKAYSNRGDNGDANDTNATIAQILKLRQQRAELLGFRTHADYRMADTMAGTPDRAMDLMMKVWPAAVARVKEEVADMQALADADAKAGKGAKITIAPWDYRYYAEKVRKQKYDLDAAAIKPYFQLDKMIAAMFDSANRLYGLSFTENTGTVPVFHPDVRTFEVRRDGKVIGLHYLDNYARSGKRSGAWATTYRSRDRLSGDDIVLGSNNNNFTKGGEGEPTLISIDDASTLFHEFGHAIDYYLTDAAYPSLAGTPRDFVEYPSQVNENWLMTPYVLQNYALHYQTGEPIPQALIDKIEKSSTFNQGFETVEYLSSALIDMKLHNRTTPVTDVDAFERNTLAELGMPKEIMMRHRLPQFNHLFSSDAYSAGYYSYLWSETMDADTWAAFEEAGGPWDTTISHRFRDLLLVTGNETDRAEAYRAFRGRDPDVKALLERRGFPTGK